MVLQTPQKRTPTLVTWEKLPEDFILPDDPVENIQQPTLAAALTDALGAANRIQPQMLIASNFALVATINQSGRATSSRSAQKRVMKADLVSLPIMLITVPMF